MKIKFSRSRRVALKGLGVCSAAVLAGGILAPREILLAAEELPHLDEGDNQAKALNYVHDASQAKAEMRTANDAFCYNCMHYQGEGDQTWGPCALFPGKSVNRNGWCSAWVAKQ